MKTLCLFLVLLVGPTTEAFVSSSTRVRGVVAISPRTTCLFAAASSPKKAAAKKSKKAKSAAADKKEKEEVETFRKPDFISSIQEKTGLSKVDSEAALQAVMETITEVRQGDQEMGMLSLSYRYHCVYFACI
jgi:predicted Zn-dependent protease